MEITISGVTATDAITMLLSLNKQKRPVKVKRATKPRKSKYGIPFKPGSKEYQTAWRKCRNIGCSYDELMTPKVVGEMRGSPQPQQGITPPPVGPHWKDIIKNSANKPHKPITEG